MSFGLSAKTQSPARRAANRKNGKLGGRPRKPVNLPNLYDLYFSHTTLAEIANLCGISYRTFHRRVDPLHSERGAA